jgi:DNA-binding NarL/FixJ family response regulator
MRLRRFSRLLLGRIPTSQQKLAAGNGSKEVASALAISVRTVETYRWRLLHKINAPSLTHLVHFAIRHKLVALKG